MTNKVLIVGPQGFLASQVLHRLRLSPNVNVLGLGRSAALKDHPMEYYTDHHSLKKDHPAIGAIYLLGSFVPYGAMNTPHDSFVKSNVQLVADLSLLYPASRIIFSSSVSVYGTPVQLPITIDSPYHAPDLYGMSKLAGEAIVRNHQRHTIIRFSSIVGRDMKPVTMIPKMIEASRSGTITVWGDGSRLQNYIDVRDAADMCIRGSEAEDNIVALGVGAQSHTNLEVAQYIQSYTGAKIEFTGTDTSASWVYDPEPSYRMLNFRPQFSLKQSLNDIIQR